MASDDTQAPDSDFQEGNNNRTGYRSDRLGGPVRGGINDAGEEDAILEGKLDNVKWLVDALSCIYSPAHKAQDVTITIPSQGGLRFSVQQIGVLHASVLIPKVAFSLFKSSLLPDNTMNLKLRLNLSLIMECLNLFAIGTSNNTIHKDNHNHNNNNPNANNTNINSTSSSSSLAKVSAHIWYEGEGNPLCIRLWDGDAHTDCKLTTLSIDEDEEIAEHNNNNEITMTDLGFYNFDIITNTVVDSEILREAIQELHYCGATTAEIKLSPNAPNFILSSPADSVASRLDGLGNDALCTIQLPNVDDRIIEAFQSFNCKRPQCSVYKLQHLTRCARGLGLSQTCKLQMNEEGMLSIVCKMKGVDIDRRGGGLDRCFVEFVIVAQEIDEDEDADEDRDEDEDEDENESGAFQTPLGRINRGRSGMNEMDNDDDDDDNDNDEDEEVAGTPQDDF